MGRNENFNQGRGRRKMVGAQIAAEKRAEISRKLREGDRPKQGQDPDQGYPITVYPDNKCPNEGCSAAYFLPKDLDNHVEIKHPPKNL